MKIITILVIVVVLGALGGAYSYFDGGKQVVENTEPTIVEKEVTVEVNPLDEQIKAREQELTAKYENIKRLEARIDVLKGERERLDTEIKSLQSELANFIQGKP